jgi:transposase-like protein
MKKRVYSDEFKQKVLAEIKLRKLSPAAVAIKHGIKSNSVVYSWLGRTNRKGKGAADKRHTDSSIKEKILAEVKEGELSVHKIAHKFGINGSTVYQWLKEPKKKEAANGKSNGYIRDVTLYLKHARTAANESIRKGIIRQYDQAHLLMMLALAELEKNGH